MNEKGRTKAFHACESCGQSHKTAGGLLRHMLQRADCKRQVDERRRRLAGGCVATSADETERESATLTQAETPLPDLDPPEIESEEIDFEPMATHLSEHGLAFPSNTEDGDDEGSNSSSNSNGNSRVVVEAFPGLAGQPIGVGIPKYTRINNALDLAGLRPSTHAVHPSPQPPPPPPASTLLDPELWPLAKWLMSNGISAGAREEFFKLKWNKDRLPWKSDHLFLKDIDTLPSVPKWERLEHVVKGDGDSEETVDIWMRDPVECVEELLGNPAFADELRFAPIKVYRDGPDGKDRVYNEMWTADWWWETQTALSAKFPNAAIAPIILASDKTQLSVFSGDKAAWPVYLTLGNIPKHLRRKTSLRATILIRYIPVSKLNHIEDDESNRIARHRLFHSAMATILDRLIEAGEQGVHITCGDSSIRHVFPLLAAYVADFPEQCLVAGCMESRCPVCETPTEGRGSIRSTEHPIRSRTSTLSAMAVRQRTGVSSSMFTRLGLRPLWPFWAKLPYTSIFECITPDALHQLHRGLFKDHLLKWANHTAGRALIDRRFSYMPHHIGLRHFKNGLSGISQTTGRENREMEKAFLSVLPGCSPQLINTSRALLDFIYTSHFTTLSETQLQSLDSYLHDFHRHKNAFVGLTGPRLQFDGIPKLHMPFHYTASIRRTGTPDGFSTEAPERYHIDYTKEAYRASNRNNYFYQMTTWLARQDSIRLWSAYMYWAFPENAGDPSSQTSKLDDAEDLDETNSDLAPPFDSTLVHSASPPLTIPYPLPAHTLAQRPPLDRKRLSWLNGAFGIKPADFKQCINKLLKQALPPGSAYLSLHDADLFDFWTRVRLVHPTNTLPTLDGPVEEVIEASPAHTDNNGRVKVPPVSSTGFLLVKPDASGITRYHVVRIRAIFMLPLRFRHLLPSHYAYVEFFSAFPASAPSTNLKQYSLTPSRRANNERNAAIVPLKALKLTCHLTPQFHRMEDDDWKDDDLVGTFSRFYLNDFSSHLMYGYLNAWRNL